MRWIKSGGGPLICLTDNLVSEWRGDAQFSGGGTVRTLSASTDYERACLVQDYAGLVAVSGGSALVLGDAPLETSVWTDAAGRLVIVRLIYAASGSDLLSRLGGVDPSSFNDPEQSTFFSVRSNTLEIFDAALPGREATNASLTASIRPADYRVLTKVVNPNKRTSFLLHRFDTLQ